MVFCFVQNCFFRTTRELEYFFFVALIGTVSIVRSDVTIFFPLKFSQLRPIFDLRLFVKPATESSKDDKLYSTPIVMSFDYFFIYGIV